MKLAVITFIFLPLLFSCRKECMDYKDPECENYNPCWDAEEVNAGFKVFETYSFPVPYSEKWYNIYETDTFHNIAIFKADCDDCEYTWLIGSGIYNTREVYLRFFSLPALSQVEITLIVKKSPNKKCFPNDDGVDTFSKIVMIGKSETNNFFKTRPSLSLPQLNFQHNFPELGPQNFLISYNLVDSLASIYNTVVENLLFQNDRYIVNAGNGGSKHTIYEMQSDSIYAIMGIYWIAPKTYNIKIEAKNKFDINPEIKNYTFISHQN